MKIYIVGDSEAQKVDVVRLDSEEAAHDYYVNQKESVLGHLNVITSATDIPSLYRLWIKDAIDLIKGGEF